MNLVTIKAKTSPVSLAAIAEFERRTDITLPHSYREFLAKYNGGEPTPDRLLVQGWHGTSTCINCFFGLGEGGFYDLEESLENAADYIPPSTLPIASDSGGNMLCLKLSGDNAGSIYFWDHESPDGIDLKNLFAVAANIDELLGKLTSSSSV
jgi:cell wall assembly regulator SMI1